MLAISVLAAGSAAAQGAGTVAGVVKSQGGVALSGARVVVVGTNLSATSNNVGRYLIRGVPAGTAELRIFLISYESQKHTIEVPANGEVTADFTMKAAPYTLEEIVSTATGEQRKLELGNTVNRIDAAAVASEAPITNVADLLKGRAPNVQVLSATGTTGGGSRIRIRGSNSVSLSNEPIIVVDGIRVESGTGSLSIGTGGQAPSRINDINPDEIENIEVIKGPSAAALYGTAAANGVILITTKKGKPGQTRWNFWTEQGGIWDTNEYPDNLFGATATGGRCRLEDQAQGTCTQVDILRSNPLRGPADVDPLGKGYRQQYGMNVSGGSETSQYFLSGEYEGERGIYSLPKVDADRISAGRSGLRDEELHPNRLVKVNLRGNAGAQVASNANIQLSTGYVSSTLRLPQNDNNILGILSSALTGDGRGASGPAGSPWGFFQPGETFQRLAQQRVQRFTGSLQGNWSPRPWLTTRGTVGLDVTQRVDQILQRFGEGPNFSTFRSGDVDDNRRQISSYSVDFGATGAFDLRPELTSKTSVGVQYFKDIFNGTNAAGQFLPPGGVTLSSSAQQQASEVTIETITLGAYVEQVFGYKDRLFVTGALRADQNSTFGQDFGSAYYPKGAVSWLVSDEPFFPQLGWLNLLRLRGAIGSSGLQPGSTDALLYFDPVTATADGGDVAGVTLGGLGNPNLKPERSTEFELGFDATVIENRVGLEVTYYNKKTRDALIAVTTPPSVGFPSTRFENIGSVRNQGIEVILNAQVLTGRNLGWDITVSGSKNTNKLLDLGGVPPIIFNASGQRHEEGFPLGGYWGRPFTWNDANGDGIIAGSEVQVGATEEYLGSSIPTRELSVNTGLTFLNSRVRLSGQLDYRGGHKLWNLTEEFRCRSSQNCLGLYDVNASEFEKARVAALRFAPGDRTNSGYIEDASYWKLRELSLTFYAPDRWANMFRASRMSITVSGRNLFTWSDYTGVDPEVNGQGTGNFAIRDFLTQPQVRYWTARVNLGF